MSGFPGLMLKQALFSDPDPECVLSSFESLATVDYGSNVRLAEYLNELSKMDDVDGYPDFNPDQFMAWFYLPSVKSLAIWLQSLKDVKEEQPNLHQLHALVIARATVTESEIFTLLEKTSALKTLHLGLAYRFTE